MHYLQAAPTFLAILLLAFLGFLVVHNQYRRVNLLFLFFVIVDSVWLASVFAINFTSYNSSVLLGRVVYASSICLVLGALLFINALLHFYRSKRAHAFLASIYVYSLLLFGLTLATPLVIRGITLSHNTNILMAFPIYGSLYVLFPVYLLLSVAAIFVPLLILGNLRRTRNNVTAQQLNLITTGLTLFTLLSLSTNLLLPTLLASSWPSLFAPVGSIVLAFSFFIAIGRYKLFDIRFVALRAAAYLSTLLIMTFVFIAPFVLIINNLLGHTITAGQFAIVVMLSASLLYVLQYLRRFFDRVTAAVFFRNYYEIQDVLDNLSNTLVRAPDLKALRESTANVLQEALKPVFLHYALFRDRDGLELAKKLREYSDQNQTNFIGTEEVRNKDHSLASLLHDKGIAMAAKLRTTHEDLGFVVVGYKRSGQLYTPHDARLLSIAADEIAISLQNMLRFEQIERFNVTLQEEVDHATAKLRRANKRLEELDNIKDDFISMASHQLRTPLTSVKGYLSMVLEGDAGTLSQMQGQMLKQAFTSSQRMVFLITDLLNVSRLKTGKFVIDRSPVNLKHLIGEELDQLHDTAAAKEIKIKFVSPKKFPELMLDEVKTRQVIMNFVDNAIYYTPQGGHIQVELVEKPSMVELKVVDDGIGVPKEEQHHLFTKFYRATNARKARPDGTGLGLFMAQKVITAQGGSILFSSREHHGSTFGFTFSKSHLAIPKKLPPAPAEVPVAPAPAAPTVGK